MLSGMVAKFKLRKWLLETCFEYLLAQIIYIVFRCFILRENVFENASFMQEIVYPYWHLWYLYALLFWSLTVPILNRIIKIIPRVLLLGTYVIFVLLSGRINIPFSLTRPIVFYTFFLIGYLYKPEIIVLFGKTEKYIRYRIGGGIILGIAFCLIGIQHKNINAQMLFEYHSYVNGNYSALERAIFLAGGTILVMAIFCCSFFVVEKLCNLGKNTLTIFIFHAMLYKVMNVGKVHQELLSYNSTILCITYGILMTVICIWILSRRVIVKGVDSCINIPKQIVKKLNM